MVQALLCVPLRVFVSSVVGSWGKPRTAKEALPFVFPWAYKPRMFLAFFICVCECVCVFVAVLHSHRRCAALWLAVHRGFRERERFMLWTWPVLAQSLTPRHGSDSVFYFVLSIFVKRRCVLGERTAPVTTVRVHLLHVRASRVLCSV